MERSWTIVRFIDEDTVEAVPSTWIINKKCYWPPFHMEKIVAAIKKHAEPNTCWPSYNVMTFRNSSYDNYKTAREKAKKAELTSELNSETDNISKRKIIPKKFFSSSDESTEECTKLRTPPIMNTQKSLKSTNYENAKSNKCQSRSVDQSSNEVPNKRTKHLQDGFLNISNILQDNEHNIQNNKTEDVVDNKIVLQYFKEIIRQQSYFKTQLWQIADDLKDMKNELLQQVHQRPNVTEREESIFSFPHLPFNSVEDLEEHVEQFLNQPNKFEISVKEVSRVGGKNPYEFIKRNCTRLLTNELAEKYSWLGAKQKRKFCHLKLADLLIVSGQDSNSEYNKKVLEEAVQKWLRRAKERLNGEKKKQDKQRTEEDSS
ncbi:uncharacterized protein LOC114940175 isoform X2 [Nylanderia fulva]|uniref:uncharacterized protein LOC114940175 isoform X2 n=1 Tax=Nylanderia fulva TaxID=613905 RepID=UPI0010FB520F|nr:uncharacterized protein LOC114940175 isoform X2 [Nylanderia fulva]